MSDWDWVLSGGVQADSKFEAFEKIREELKRLSKLPTYDLAERLDYITEMNK